jgi:ribosomal protein L37E
MGSDPIGLGWPAHGGERASTLRGMPDSTYFEVRCERCKTSFAAGTKQCVHCGGAIGRRLLAFDGLAGRGASMPDASEREPGAPDAQPSLGRVFQLVMIVLVVVTAIARACVGES